MSAVAEVSDALGRESQIRETLALRNGTALPRPAALGQEPRDPGLDSREVLDHVNDGPLAWSEGTGLKLGGHARNGGSQGGPLRREELDCGRRVSHVIIAGAFPFASGSADAADAPAHRRSPAGRAPSCTSERFRRGELRRRAAHCSPCNGDRKSTRLNSSHLVSSYAVFCWHKKTVT